MMFRKFIICCCVAILAGVCFVDNFAYAKPFTGQAVIENGNVEKARSDARRAALREFAESEVGIHINSRTETVNYMVVTDRVVSNSDSYVLIKKVIKEHSLGDIYEVVLDLEAGKTPVEMAITDVKGQIASVGSDSSRNGVDIAVYDDDAKKTSYWANYLTATMNTNGYDAQSNDAINTFLAQNINRLNDLQLNAELRRMGRAERMANSLIRGRVGLAKRATPVQGGGYMAVATFSAQIIAYDSNSIDAVSRFASAVESTPEEAEKRAKEKVVYEAMDIMATQSATTIQREQGRGTIKTTLIFSGFINKSSESQIILNAIGKVGARVVRNAFVANGTFRVFVSSNNVNNISELADAVVKELQLQGYSQVQKYEDEGVGAIKYIIKLRG